VTRPSRAPACSRVRQVKGPIFPFLLFRHRSSELGSASVASLRSPSFIFLHEHLVVACRCLHAALSTSPWPRTAGTPPCCAAAHRRTPL
jgi:hypothetical protein